jgi:hypothetical protein
VNPRDNPQDSHRDNRRADPRGSLRGSQPSNLRDNPRDNQAGSRRGNHHAGPRGSLPGSPRGNLLASLRENRRGSRRDVPLGSPLDTPQPARCTRRGSPPQGRAFPRANRHRGLLSNHQGSPRASRRFQLGSLADSLLRGRLRCLQAVRASPRASHHLCPRFPRGSLRASPACRPRSGPSRCLLGSPLFSRRASRAFPRGSPQGGLQGDRRANPRGTPLGSPQASRRALLQCPPHRRSL